MSGQDAWEQLESRLAELFDLLLASANRAAFKVYQSSKSTSARREMLTAAIPMHGAGDTINAELSAFSEVVGKFAARRNELAHGQVFSLQEHGFYLAPSNLMKNKWTKDGAAKYQYTAADIAYYAQQFATLNEQCTALI